MHDPRSAYDAPSRRAHKGLADDTAEVITVKMDYWGLQAKHFYLNLAGFWIHNSYFIP